jgi:hypothetical protein
LKKEVSPAIVGIIILVLVVAVGFFIWKGTAGGGGKAPGESGNPSPFGPGGAALGKGGGTRNASGSKR